MFERFWHIIAVSTHVLLEIGPGDSTRYFKNSEVYLLEKYTNKTQVSPTYY